MGLDGLGYTRATRAGKKVNPKGRSVRMVPGTRELKWNRSNREQMPRETVRGLDNRPAHMELVTRRGGTRGENPPGGQMGNRQAVGPVAPSRRQR